jgi:hypothetical protein
MVEKLLKFPPTDKDIYNDKSLEDSGGTLEESFDSTDTEERDKAQLSSGVPEDKLSHDLKTNFTPSRKYLEDPSILITGTAGIGKTVLGFYLIYRILHNYKNQPFAYGSIATNQGFVYYDGSKFSYMKNYPFDYKSNTVFIIDGEESCGANIITNRPVILIASPRDAHYNNFKKRSPLYSFTLPVWSFYEIVKCRMTIFDDLSMDLVNKLYTVFGGVPRSIFESTGYNVSVENLKRAIETTDIDLVRKHIGESAKDDKISSSILHITVNNSYQQESVVFATRYIQRKICSLIKLDKLKEIAHELKQRGNHWLYKQADGQVFEYFVHLVLAKKWPTPYKMKLLRRRTTDAINAKHPTELVMNDDHDIEIFEKQDIEEKKYYIPQLTNFSTIDSFVSGKVFSITSDIDHSVNITVDFVDVMD